ncbi:sensor histidine kinase [Paenibacillus humicola]|uniref:sensor histidine kinase n=1 Tax=Paenibacillus humicola TaxID=3110540 RepID=UPI00237B518A|nr:sensor histidine kinase [Paenibacillus humicola]
MVFKKRFFSIRSKVMLFAVVLTVFPLLIVSGFSYFESIRVVRDQTIDLNLINAKQISNNLDLIVSDVNTISLNLIQNREIADFLSTPDPQTRQLDYPRILSVLNDQAFNKKYIYSIYIQDLSETGVDNRGAVNLVPDNRLLQAKAYDGKDSWYFDSVFVQNQEIKVISMIRDIRDINDIGRSLGVLKINVPESAVRELFRTKSKSQEKSLFYLIDQQKNILSALPADRIGSRIEPNLTSPGMDSRTEGDFNATVGGQNYLAIYYRMATQNWYIVELTPYKLISGPGNAIKRVTFYSIAASLAVCVLFIVLFGARVLEPLKRIRELMRQVERENFNLEMKVQGNDEIALLAGSFNRMSHRLNELINEVHVSKLKQKDAELKALEEQINPHFLYNTLDLIYWMSRMEQAYETSVMVNSLSQLFRIGLNSGSRFTTVAKEVEHIEHYILIQQKRYEETIDFSIDLEPKTRDCRVTKMVLQPIVENAIRHGIEPGGGDGRVEIRIFREGDDLVYLVSDDGEGIDGASVQAVLDRPTEKQRGLGLKNIHDRIKLNCGSRYGVEFRSASGQGTAVTVRQPFRKGTVSDV